MTINAAIQLLPLVTSENKFSLIDKAISLIQNSGLNYKVCPFETVVEGETEEIYSLMKKIQEETLKSKCEELLLNIKIHAANRNLHFEEKLVKYE